MSERDLPDFIAGRFGAAIRIRSDVWYAEHMVEFLVIGEPGPRGGRPETTQVLMTFEQARRVMDDLAAALATTTPDPRATAREDGGDRG